MTDPIADMLTRIRNASLVKKDEVLIPFSKIKFEVAKILAKEGYVGKISEINDGKINSTIQISLKYKNKMAVIRGIKKISKPGLRIYKGYKEIPRLLPSLGLLIVSTSNGLMTNIDAKKHKMGGEILCEIF